MMSLISISRVCEKKLNLRDEAESVRRSLVCNEWKPNLQEEADWEGQAPGFVSSRAREYSKVGEHSKVREHLKVGEHLKVREHSKVAGDSTFVTSIVRRDLMVRVCFQVLEPCLVA